MKNIFLVSILVGGLCITHASMTALYLAPINPLTQKYIKPVTEYMEPLFNQNWMLFAPEPAKSSLQIWYRCSSAKGSSVWMDPMATLVEEHQNTRFTFRGKLLYVYQAIARDALNTYVRHQKTLNCNQVDNCHQETLKAIDNTSAVQTAHRFIGDICRQSSDSEEGRFESAEFMVVKVFPKPYSQKDDPKAQGAIEAVRFNDFKI